MGEAIHIMSTIKLKVGLVVVLVCAVSCKTYYHLPESVEIPQSTAMAPLILMPGDEIDVRFRYWPEFDDVQTIRPDGKISLQLVQGVEAAGQTPESLQEKLAELYSDKIRDPDIIVIVRSLVNQKIYVGGQVAQPGLFDMRGRMTALEAIMLAGGFLDRSAQMRNVVIVRHVDGQRYAGTIDMRAMLADAESEPFYLQQNDIVFVPRTVIHQVNQWVDQYFNRVVPLGVLQGLEIIDDLNTDLDFNNNNDNILRSLPLDLTSNPIPRPFTLR